MKKILFGLATSVALIALMLFTNVPLVSSDCTQVIAGGEGTSGSPKHPAVDARDNYVYSVYALNNQKYEKYNIAIRYSSNGGQNWGPYYWVSESPHTQDFPDIKLVPANGACVIHIVWQEEITDSEGNQYWVIKHRAAVPGPIYDPSHYHYDWTATTQISTNNYGYNALYPKVSADDADDSDNIDYSWVHITWQQDIYSPPSQTGWGIKYKEGYTTYGTQLNPYISITWSLIYSLSNDNNDFDDIHPAISSSEDPNGYGPSIEHWYVVWQENYGSSSEIIYRGGISSPGNPPTIDSQTTQISQAGPGSYASEPDISAKFDWVSVVWQEPIPDSSTAGEVHMRNSNSYGSSWLNIFQLTPNGYPCIDLSTWGPAIDHDSIRTYIGMICYVDSTESDNELYYSVYDFNSNSWVVNEYKGPETNYPNAKQSYPDIATESQSSAGSIPCGLTVFENITANYQQIVFTRYNPNNNSCYP